MKKKKEKNKWNAKDDNPVYLFQNTMARDMLRIYR